MQYSNEHPKIELDSRFSDYKLPTGYSLIADNNTHMHEAGYDAMATGYVFAKYLYGLKQYNESREDAAKLRQKAENSKEDKSPSKKGSKKTTENEASTM